MLGDEPVEIRYPERIGDDRRELVVLVAAPLAAGGGGPGSE
jgi:hypothetical protein